MRGVIRLEIEMTSRKEQFAFHTNLSAPQEDVSIAAADPAMILDREE
jgi:hypothetical protein